MRGVALSLLLVPPIAVGALLAGFGVIGWDVAFLTAGAVDAMAIFLFEVPSEGPLIRRRRRMPPTEDAKRPLH